ncbi:hypothetical protein BV394_11585 [Brevirhabdus pacifica]|uniref:Uncharacterized protein n=1 Tax=Brevirhabdus pacifica TaxID=1267768 RepID=A0A1U7DJX6_9RHOB|nr:hypothetical protein [Brevirhabdus pacifica]APX90286.1 hypothetical protein BV394_11585 [Brevirhabdus pacifica]OWU78668.1 hypothetical protein ATO5_07870 [Loktanella sp. 22II-4b]PJJ80735.1 hypothetical protein CLV77_3006 [Brevirhabdus pacifica]
MTRETTLLWLLPGLALVTAARLLLRVAASPEGRGQPALPSPFGDAVAALAGWFALFGMSFAAFFQLGLIAAVLVALAGWLLPRALPAGAALVPYLYLKLPLALGAMIVACLLLFGVILVFEGVFYG